MRIVAFAVAAFVLVLAGDARAGGGVDWSDYIDKDGSSKLPAQKTSTVVAAQDEAPPPAAKAAPAKKGKRGARATKAKTSKAKVKSRAKSKKRR